MGWKKSFKRIKKKVKKGVKSVGKRLKKTMSYDPMLGGYMNKSKDSDSGYTSAAAGSIKRSVSSQAGAGQINYTEMT